MISETPRTRRHLAAEARILDAAEGLLDAEGPRALSMRRVADAADFTAGALYRYFPSKDALMRGVLVRGIAQLGAEVATIAAETRPPLACIVAQIRAWQAVARRDAAGFGLINRAFADPRVLLPDDTEAMVVLEAARGAFAPMTAALGQAAAQGELEAGDVVERALLTFAALQGVLMVRKLERVGAGWINTDHLVGQLIRSLLGGWGASDEAIETALRTGEKQ